MQELGGISSGGDLAKIVLSATFGAIGGLAAASGISWVTSGVLGAVTESVKSVAYQLIDNKGDFRSLNYVDVGMDFASGFVSGAIGGKGAINGDKYMQKQVSRFLNHVTSDGLIKAGTFFYKMTAKTSKKYVGSTLVSIVKSTVASHFM